MHHALAPPGKGSCTKLASNILEANFAAIIRGRLTNQQQKDKERQTKKNMSQEFVNHALLRLEEAKEILMEVETMEAVDLPKLKQEKLKRQNDLGAKTMELEEICLHVDEVKQELKELNDAIMLAQTQQKEANEAAAKRQVECHTTNHCSATNEDCIDSHSLLIMDATQEANEKYNENNMEAIRLADDDISTTDVSATDSRTGVVDKKNKKRTHRRSVQPSPKKWRRMIRSNRLRSILLVEQ